MAHVPRFRHSPLKKAAQVLPKTQWARWLRSHRLWMTLTYFLVIALPAWQVVHYTQEQVSHFQQICDIDNFQNNIMADHSFLGPVIKAFIHQRKVRLPGVKEAQQSLGEMPRLAQLAKNDEADAGIGSWFLLSLSLVYVVLTLAVFGKDRWNQLLFSLTMVSVVFFVVGISAPAMVIVVISPENAVVHNFVLDDSSRSILGVLSQLFSYGHWLIAGLLTFFSVVIPIIKAASVLVALEAASLAERVKISKFLNLIGKWSMADVFVAAIILANFAIRADRSTPRTDLIIGFYYFLGYCFLSMLVTTFLHLQLERANGRSSRLSS